MIHFKSINSESFDSLLSRYNSDIALLSERIPGLSLRSYDYYLRCALNYVQPESFNHLLIRLESNRELEQKLDSFGGYTNEFIDEYNPKRSLLEILKHLKLDPLKLNALLDHVSSNRQPKTILSDLHDIDYLKRLFNGYKVHIITYSQFKTTNYRINPVIYSFNGTRDYDFIRGIEQDCTLVLHELEKTLYNDQVMKRKMLLENEINSADRVQICGIRYKFHQDHVVELNSTIKKVVNRIDSLAEIEYENYKEDAESLLEDTERCYYLITLSNGEQVKLESNDTVFTREGELVKVYRSDITLGKEIRVYPKEKFADSLYKIALLNNNELFTRMEEHSALWISALKGLKQKHGPDLYAKLRENGLRVLPLTVESYLSNQRKFPMYNSDLKAIFKLFFNDSGDSFNDLLVAIRKSKGIYNSTMIALGRGLKQEIKAFLIDGEIGPILTNLKFNSTSMKIYVDLCMPLLEILSKEIDQDFNMITKS